MSEIADVCVIGTGAGGGVWIDACTRAGRQFALKITGQKAFLAWLRDSALPEAH